MQDECTVFIPGLDTATDAIHAGRKNDEDNAGTRTNIQYVINYFI